jgi:hypothetical protein
MTDSTDQFKYLLGKIDGVALLAAALAASSKPGAADLLLSQCRLLHERVARGGEALSAYEQGLLSTEGNVLAALKVASDLEQRCNRFEGIGKALVEALAPLGLTRRGLLPLCAHPINVAPRNDKLVADAQHVRVPIGPGIHVEPTQDLRLLIHH